MNKIDQPEHNSVPAGISIEQTKIKVKSIAREIDSPRSPIENAIIAPNLFNLETHEVPERPLGLRLNLYQMEKP